MRRQVTFLILPPSLEQSEAFPFSGEVVSILDGGPIEVLHNGKAQRVRLHGIDCPERGQPFGNNAKQAISAMVFALEGALQIHGKDKYGRILADVLLNGTNVNQELAKEGWCYRQARRGERLELPS